MPDQRGYRTYLLRLWPAHTAGGIVWRASLEDPHSGTRLGFSSIRRLHEFLLDQTDEVPSPADIGSPPDDSFGVRDDHRP